MDIITNSGQQENQQVKKIVFHLEEDTGLIKYSFIGSDGNNRSFALTAANLRNVLTEYFEKIQKEFPTVEGKTYPPGEEAEAQQEFEKGIKKPWTHEFPSSEALDGFKLMISAKEGYFITKETGHSPHLHSSDGP